MKRCGHCKQFKPESEYHKCKDRSDGLSNKCKSCAAEFIKLDRVKHKEKRKKSFADWRERNREHLQHREAIRKMTKRYQCLIAQARKRARNRGLAFDLDEHTEEIRTRVEAGVCEITGLPFNLLGGRTWDSPSIDRINAKQGYTIDNVRIICYGMNAALGDWGEDVLKTMVDAWSRKPRRSS